MADRERRSREEVLEELADKALNWDNSSVLKKNALVDTIRYAFGKIHYKKRPQLINEYNENAVTRRDFLKFLGFASGSAFATYFGAGYFIDKHYLDRPIESVTGYASGDVFNLEAQGAISPGGSLNQAINSNQGKNIVVPGEEYTFDSAIQADGNTRIIFEGTTIDPQVTNQRVFTTSGNGWHIGGDADILQNERNYCGLFLRGEGQFGDDQGRISWQGRIPHDAIPRKNSSGSNHKFLVTGSGSGTIRLMNFDQLGPVEGATDAGFYWTDRPGRVEAIGLNVHGFNDNLFYIKMLQGEFLARDCYFKDNNVAAWRTGANGGTTIERCDVVATDWNNPAITAGNGGVNHSCLAVQSGDNQIGQITMREVHYEKRGGGGLFLRDMGDADKADIVVEDCQWTGYPDYHSDVPDSNVTIQGSSGGTPETEPPEGAVEPGGSFPSGGGSRGSGSANC